MSRVKVELSDKGIIELMKSTEITNHVDDIATQIYNRVDKGEYADGYSKEIREGGRTRNAVRISVNSYEALGHEHKHNSLLKALGG